MKLLLRGKQSKTKHVVHVKVINLRWISSFLFFLSLSQILFSTPSATCRGQSLSLVCSYGNTIAFQVKEGKSLRWGEGVKDIMGGCRMRNKGNDLSLGKKMTSDHAGWFH